jgi:hypothetical protein
VNNKVIIKVLWLCAAVTIVLALSVKPVFGETMQLSSPISAFGHNFLRFGLLFTTSIVLLSVIAFLQRKQISAIQAGLIAALFGFLFFNIWTIALPYGRFAEQAYFIAQTRDVLTNGRIPIGATNSLGEIAFPYLDFPGISLLLGDTSQLTAVRLLLAPDILLIVAGSTLPLLMFVISRHNLSVFNSLLTSIFLSEGYEFLSRTFFFRPDPFSIVLFATLLAFLRKPHAYSRSLALLVLTSSIVIFHFPTAIFAMAVLFGMMTVRPSFRNGAGSHIILPAIIIVLSWLIFWSVYWFPLLPSYLLNLQFRSFSLNYNLYVASSNLTVSEPFYVLVVRNFWFAIIYGLGTICGLSMISKRKTLSWYDPRNTATILVVGLASFLLLISFDYHIYTYVEFSIFLVLPPLIGFLNKFIKSERFRNISILGMICLIALPTLVAFNPSLGINAIYQSNINAASFAADSIPSNYIVGASTLDGALLIYYSPATAVNSNFGVFNSTNQFYLNIGLLFADQVTIVSNGFFVGTNYPDGPSPTDSAYRILITSVELNHDMVYSNGYVSVMQKPIAR